METFTPSAIPSPQLHSQSQDLQRAAQLSPLNLPGDSHSPLGMKSLPLWQGKEYICSPGDTKVWRTWPVRVGHSSWFVLTQGRQQLPDGGRRDNG